jgi:parallel beta-helix repeat protein
MFYANGKHNLIIDSIKTDGKYYDSPPSSSATITMGIKFDGTTNNSTINNIQTFNDTQYGIYFGVGSHHNTIMNSQLFNNGIAGIHFYYSSDYNVINNTQTYNNS